MRGATRTEILLGHAGRFQSTLLMRGATDGYLDHRLADAQFQSTLLMRGATPVLAAPGGLTIEFQSTLLMRGATLRPRPCRQHDADFNPRSSCEERRAQRHRWWPHLVISIHAPHARSDPPSIRGSHHARVISIHAPHARSDGEQKVKSKLERYFNPRSSCEERPRGKAATYLLCEFQSTLLMRGATWARILHVSAMIFQSTLLMRGATDRSSKGQPSDQISIHAPHARSDEQAGGMPYFRQISIHAPHARSDFLQ